MTWQNFSTININRGDAVNLLCLHKKIMERRNGGAELNGVYIDVGEITVIVEKTSLIAVTGRNVVVCIWEKISKISGMCNYKKTLIHEKGKTTAIYGNAAVFKLIDMIKKNVSGWKF